MQILNSDRITRLNYLIEQAIGWTTFKRRALGRFLTQLSESNKRHIEGEKPRSILFHHRQFWNTFRIDLFDATALKKRSGTDLQHIRDTISYPIRQFAEGMGFGKQTSVVVDFDPVTNIMFVKLTENIPVAMGDRRATIDFMSRLAGLLAFLQSYTDLDIIGNNSWEYSRPYIDNSEYVIVGEDKVMGYGPMVLASARTTVKAERMIRRFNRYPNRYSSVTYQTYSSFYGTSLGKGATNLGDLIREKLHPEGLNVMLAAGAYVAAKPEDALTVIPATPQEPKVRFTLIDESSNPPVPGINIPEIWNSSPGEGLVKAAQEPLAEPVTRRHLKDLDVSQAYNGFDLNPEGAFAAQESEEEGPDEGQPDPNDSDFRAYLDEQYWANQENKEAPILDTPGCGINQP